MFAVLAMAFAAVLGSATSVDAKPWQEDISSDAIQCDLDGNGATEYVAWAVAEDGDEPAGTLWIKGVIRQDKRGVYHLNGTERLEGVQYYSAVAEESVYITGRTHLVGTLGVASNGDFYIDDAMGSVRITIKNVDGEVIGAVSGTSRWTDGVVELINSKIDGVCEMPYEPAE